jgi:hypothetical protein
MVYLSAQKKELSTCSPIASKNILQKRRGEMKIFSDEEKLREFFIGRHALNNV